MRSIAVLAYLHTSSIVTVPTMLTLAVKLISVDCSSGKDTSLAFTWSRVQTRSIGSRVCALSGRATTGAECTTRPSPCAEAVQNHDYEAHSPPLANADDESDSSISDVEWETIHQPLEHVVDGMIAAGQDVISAVNEFSNFITRTMKESFPTQADENGLGR